MAKTSKVRFDDLAVAFADYGTTVRGYVRYQLIRRNLEPYISSTSLQALDVGGGSGADTAWLAERGHHVMYIEPSQEQRRFAERRFNFLIETNIRERITLGGDSLADLSGVQQTYDLVLVHAVAMYQADAEAFLIDCLRYVKPGGMVSVVEKNYYGSEDRAIRRRNFNELSKLQKTGRATNNLMQNVHAFKPEAVQALLENHNFETLEWSGVRTITDEFDMPVDKFTKYQLGKIVDAEYLHGHHPAIRGQGQMIHFIARRSAT